MRYAFIVVILLLLSAGCIRPAERPAVTTVPVPEIPPAVSPDPVIVSAQRIDSGRILITYEGGPDADQLLELETTVITGRGSAFIRSMGSRLDTTPVRIGGTDIFPGPFPETVHVLTVAYYTNGSHRDVLDTRV